MKKQIYFITSLVLFFNLLGFAQVKIGDNPTIVGTSSALELESTNKSLVITRVVNTAEITAPVNGMIIYDLSSNCFKGYQGGFWSECGFTPVAAQVVTSGGTAVVLGYTCNTASAGTMAQGTPVSGVTQTITATVTTVGTYNISTTTANGVTFAANGIFAGTGAQNIVFTATGTPIAKVSNTYTLNTTPNCGFSRTTVDATSGGSGIVSAYVCNTTTVGTMTQGSTTTGAGVSQNITATVTTVGTYNISTTANGVTFAATGTFAGTGAQVIVLTATGTPTAAGTNAFALNTTPGCSFNRTTNAPTTTITSTTGKIWMDRNLGATRVATSVTDHLAYGDLYQWGRRTDGHEKITWTNSTTGTRPNGTVFGNADIPAHSKFITINSAPNDWRVSANDNLWTGVAAVNNPCPAGFRVPTIAEMTAEVTAYNITNSATAFSSPFKFTVPGNQNSGGIFSSIGSQGNYWCSTVSGSVSSSRFFDSGSTSVAYAVRSNGYSVRCIAE